MLSAIKGSFIIAQTPFDERGAVDLASIDSLTEFYLGHGADGFVVLGVSGEGGKLTPEEAQQVSGRFIARAQGKPVIVGVSNPSTAQLALLAKQAMDQGASGVMIAPPGGLRTEVELLGYFATVFGMIGDVPTVLQDFPGSTGVWMSVPSILKLVESHAQIQVVKEEDLPSLEKITQLRAGGGRRVAILTGNNGLYLPQEMGRGIDGPMAGFSHPEMLSGVYRLFTQGREDEAHDLFDRYLPLLNYEAQGFWGVAARKEVMRRRGAIRHATMRMPGPKLSAIHMGEIDRLLRNLERTLAARR
ncbi:dihydrodipicolinate synthase family protein [Roseomonas aerophila]|uniref:Dihydrodipicolinate synthase family protein n=1 Tax=Teichococcus aerophilus TaxID=1224513 RepID=A0ABR7RKX3_9PROT|nr:dihydrodipicolinate synthase family protein [Pseudoroseomonas aerophila]MBC9207078.1 dihydrodipicolinate synthase family protein [Pseudoroseomonas aerophila]